METDNGQQGHSLSLVNVDLFEINLVAGKGVLLQGSGDAAPRWPFTPKARAKPWEAQEVHRKKNQEREKEPVEEENGGRRSRRGGVV